MTAPHRKKRVLFVCTHNSARSQMAEGLLRARGGDRFEVCSAGTEPRGVNPLAARVMQEIDIDLSDHRSEHVDRYLDPPPDVVVTVCDSAREACPYLPAREQAIHRSFEDPSAATGTEEERLAVFRRVRDEIGDWLAATFVEPQPSSSVNGPSERSS